MTLMQRLERAQQRAAEAAAANGSDAPANGADGTAAPAPGETPTASPANGTGHSNGSGPSNGTVPASDTAPAPTAASSAPRNATADMAAKAAALVPVMAPAPAGPRPAHTGSGGLRAPQAPAREDLIHEVRLRLQKEVVGAFKLLLETKDGDVRKTIEPMVDRVVEQGGFAVTRAERARLVDEMVHDVTGFGPLEPLLADPSITEVMVNGPDHIYIERKGKIHPYRLGLPQRPARPSGHRADHRPARPTHRRVEPAGRCPPARRLARQRDHRPAVADRARDHRPQVRPDPVHGRRSHQLRDGHPGDVRVPPARASRQDSISSSRAGQVPARPRPSTSCRRSSGTTSAS